MRVEWKATAVVLLAGVLVALPGAAAQKARLEATARDQERRSLAINIVRTIDKAEANYKKNHGVYATWDTLVGNGDFTSTGTKWAPESLPTVAHAMYGDGPEIVPGWRLRLNLSRNGSAYDLLLEDVNDPKCDYAVASDERGRVREGKAVECET
jgi:hypothetical protein